MLNQRNVSLNVDFRYFMATFPPDHRTWLWRGMEPSFLTLPGQNKKAWCAYVDIIVSTQWIHWIFMDVMQFIYSTVFLSFFISSHTERKSHILWFSSIGISSIFLNWLWGTSSPSWRPCATLWCMQMWEEWPLSSCSTENSLNNKSWINQWTLWQAVWWSDTSQLPSLSLCDSCGALLFLFSGTIVILHDLFPDTGWHFGQTPPPPF